MNKEKKMLTILLTIVLAVCFIGCGKKEPDDKEVVSELESSETLILEGPEENESQNIEEMPIYFECMEEIKEASPESGLVQVDDMLLQYGCKVSEVIEAVENSQSSFEYLHDYNENELVIKGDTVEIVLMKNGEHYLSLQARNLTDEAIGLKDCIIGRIMTEKTAKGNTFYAGFDEKINDVSAYEYIRNDIMKEFEVSYELTERDHDMKKYFAEVYIIPSSLSETGDLWLYFVIEADTGEFRSVSINSTSISSFL